MTVSAFDAIERIVKLNEFLDSRAFYELSQAYRHAPVGEPAAVVEAWEALKAGIRSVGGADGNR